MKLASYLCTLLSKTSSLCQLSRLQYLDDIFAILGQISFANITYSPRLQKALAIWDWNWSKLNFNSLQTKNLYQCGKGEKQRILKYISQISEFSSCYSCASINPSSIVYLGHDKMANSSGSTKKCDHVCDQALIKSSWGSV